MREPAERARVFLEESELRVEIFVVVFCLVFIGPSSFGPHPVL